jgi:hypothetical protein
VSVVFDPLIGHPGQLAGRFVFERLVSIAEIDLTAFLI